MTDEITAVSSTGSTGFGTCAWNPAARIRALIFGARIARQRHCGQKPSMFGFMLPNLPDQGVPVFHPEDQYR